MPISNDILDREVIGPAIQQGLDRGRQEGRNQMLKGLLEKRFGPIPPRVGSRINSLSADQLDALAVRVLDVTRLEELFPGLH